MTNRISFYFRQAFFNWKKSILSILIISIGISVVAGTFYYTDSYTNSTSLVKYNAACDINVNFIHNQINYTSNIIDNYGQILQAVNKSDLNIEQNFRYAFLPPYSFYISQNLTNNSEDKSTTLNLNFETPLRVFITDDDFYQSVAFSQSFILENGTFPSNQSEILIANSFATKFNYYVGEKTNLTAFGEFGLNTTSCYNITNLTISGIYQRNLKHNDKQNFSFLGTYNYLPIFSYQNFSSSINDNPFQLYCYNIYNFFKKSNENLGNFGFQYGVGLIYNKSNINYNNLRTTIITIKSEISNLQNNLPTGITTTNYIIDDLNSMASATYIVARGIFFFSIPIFIFTIIIASFSINLNIQSRYDEFLLLKIRGTPKKMIQNQLITESLLIGIGATIFGSFFGIIMFDLNEFWIGYSFFGIQKALPLHINYQSIIITFIFSIGLTLICSWSSIRKMNKIEICDILTKLGEDNLPIEYDEYSLFGISNPSYISDIQKVHKSKNSKLNKIYKKLGFSLKIYKNIVKNLVNKREKKTHNISYIFLIFSFIPLILYFIGRWSLSSNAPDILFNYLNSLYNDNALLSFLSFISSGLMTFGILLFITKESPLRFAKISRFLSKPFLKGKSYLVGLEMIKRKKFITIIFLIGVFSSFFIFINFLYHTNSRYPIIENNLNIGTDLKLQAYMPSQIYNTSQTQTLDNALLNITNDNGTHLIKNVLTNYRQYEKSGLVANYFNFSKYLQMIQSGGKFIPNNLVPLLSKVIAYDRNSSNEYPAAIINKETIGNSNIHIGDVLQINHVQYDPITKNKNYTVYKVKIIGEYVVIPGIDINSQISTFEGIYEAGGLTLAVDSSIFNQTSQLLPITYCINQLVNLNFITTSNDTQIQYIISNSTKNLIKYTDYLFYNQQWDSPQLAIITTSADYDVIMYYEFIMLGILLSFGLAIMMISFQNDNKYFFGILMARGFGKRGVLLFMISQMVIIFLLAILSGSVCGALTSIISNKLYILSNASLRGLNIPLYIDGIKIFEVLGLIVAVCFSVYILTYLFQKSKSINEFMRKF